MWYILQADKGAKLNSGFNKKLDEKIYLKHLNENTLDEILNFEEVKEGDVFFLPAGRVHYIGKGVCLAEIQQTSDITYRIYDFDRTDDNGNKRELHTEQALAAIDYKHYNEYKSSYKSQINQATEIVSCPYFTTNLIDLENTALIRDYSRLDSFVIYVCTEGALTIQYDKESLAIKKGDSVLIPAKFKNITLNSSSPSKILEVYIP